MPLPLKKPSERLKKRPDQNGSDLEESPLEILKKRFFRRINTRLGWQLGAALLLAGGGLWIGWDTVQKLPGVAVVLTKMAELRSVPHAQGDKFSILVAKLENDKDGVHRRLIDDALRGKFDKEIEVLLPDRSITIGGTDKPQEAVKAGHERARALLREADANVMIWGEALDTKTDALLRLHWTVNAQSDLKKSSEKYRPADTNYDLPELFWADLSDVLALLATSQAAAFSNQKGSYVADQLEPFIKRVQLLVASGKLVSQQQGSLKAVSSRLFSKSDACASTPAPRP